MSGNANTPRTDPRHVVLATVVVLGFIVCLIYAQLSWHLATGWATFIARTASRLRVRWEVVWSVTAYALALTLGAHFFLRWLYREMRGSGNNPLLPGVWRWRWTLSGLILFVLMFLAGTAAVALVHQTTWLLRSPHRMYALERGNRVFCASNLKMIGLAIEQYRKEHDGKYPDDLETIFLHGDLPAECFICRSTLHLPPPGKTREEQAANLSKPGHCSYLYLGKGLSGSVNPMRAIAVEHPDNHEGQGMNVLFADGYAEWFPVHSAAKLLTDPEAFVNLANSSPR